MLHINWLFDGPVIFKYLILGECFGKYLIAKLSCISNSLEVNIKRNENN
jgi:hypothetical protein